MHNTATYSGNLARGFASHNDAAEPALLGKEGALYATRLERLVPYAAEFIGTFLLTTCFLCNLNAESDWAISAHALLMVGLMSAFGHLSGANLNPSVSISLWLSGRRTLWTTLRLCLAQVLGAAASVAAAHWTLRGSLSVKMGPRQGHHAGDVAAVEVLFTGMICFVYLNCAASPRNNPTGDQNGFAGMATGFCYIAGGHASRGVSGTVMNPAIAFGLQLADMSETDVNAWAIFYLFWEVVGAFLASGALRVVRPDEGHKGASRKAFHSAQTVAEFAGTYYLVLTKALTHRGSPANESWAVFAVLLCMICSLRDISGGFFNPAVTLAVSVSHPLGGPGSPIGCRRLVAGVGAQFLGALAAASTFAAIDQASLPVRPAQAVNGRAAVFAAEGLFTFLLCFAVLSTSWPRSPLGTGGSRQNNVAGLAVAGAHFAAGVCIGPVSGSVLNPAQAIAFAGLGRVAGSGRCSSYLAYVLPQLFGAVLASLVCSVTHCQLHEEDAGVQEEDSREQP